MNDKGMISLAKEVEQLPIRQRSVYTVNYAELEDFIAKSFMLKQEFSIPADQETGNDTSIELIVAGTIYDYERDRLKRFLANESDSFMLNVLMDYLCMRGRIPAGDYIVQVSW